MGQSKIILTIMMIIASIFLSSCGSKKVITEYKERIVKDTIEIVKDRVIYKGVKDTIRIDQPCDSLGNLKPINSTITSDLGKIEIKSINNTLVANVRIDSIVTIHQRDSIKTSETNSDTKSEKIIRYKTPFWLIMAFVISIALNIVLLRK